MDAHESALYDGLDEPAAVAFADAGSPRVQGYSDLFLRAWYGPTAAETLNWKPVKDLPNVYVEKGGFGGGRTESRTGWPYKVI